MLFISAWHELITLTGLSYIQFGVPLSHAIFYPYRCEVTASQEKCICAHTSFLCLRWSAHGNQISQHFDYHIEEGENVKTWILKLGPSQLLVPWCLKSTFNGKNVHRVTTALL